ncbi:MAG: CHASE2 domain-containing protein, partial [bacterium]
MQLQDVWGRLTNKWVLGCAISFVAALVTLLLGLTSTFQNLELKSYDVRFAFRGAEDASKSDIVIVALDEQAIASIPQKLPYPRSYYAKLVD